MTTVAMRESFLALLFYRER